VHILRESAMRTVPLRTKTFYEFWWNQELDCLKEKSITDHQLWKAAGKPRSGAVYATYRSSKLAYKVRIREFQQQEDTVYTNDLHETLIAKRGPAFWNCWRSKFDPKSRRVVQVDGQENNIDIVDNFESFFSHACSKKVVII